MNLNFENTIVLEPLIKFYAVKIGCFVSLINYFVVVIIRYNIWSFTLKYF